MGDGAHLGVSAERALNVIVGGGSQPTEDEMETADEMRARLLALTEMEESYSGAADWTAAQILRWLMEDPARVQTPSESEYDFDNDPNHGSEGLDPKYVISEGWYNQMKKAGLLPSDLGLTGFQWGWAVNAARRCLELPPVPNPAIITVETEET